MSIGDGAPPRDEITSELITPVAGRLESLAGLAERIDRVVTDHQVLRTRASVAMTLCITLLVLVITMLVDSCRVRGTRGSAPVSTAPVVSPAAAEPAVGVPPEGTATTEQTP